MKKAILFILPLVLFLSNVFAQKTMRPLTGNGKEKQTRLNLKAFDKLEVLWLDGKIEVEFGVAESDMTITTDDNIFNLLKITNTEGSLSVEIENNFRNRLWLEDDKTTIKIRTPLQPRQIIYKANADATFRGINSPMLTLDKEENGDIVLIGKAEQLVLSKSGNGGVQADNLIAENASVRMTGNGWVSIHAKTIISKDVRGNGNLTNKAENVVEKPMPKVKRVNITFFNPASKRKEYYVTGTNERGSRFSYGLALGAMASQSEYLPIGTQIFRKGVLLATLTDADDKQLVRL